MKDRLDRIRGYDVYVGAVKKVVSKMDRIAEALSNCQTIESMIFDEQTRVNSYEKNVEIEESYFYDILKIKKDDKENETAASAFVIAKDTVSKIHSRMKNLITMDLQFTPYKHYKISDEVNKMMKWFNPNHFIDANNKAKTFLVRYVKQLAMIENITTLESKVDREQAKIFAYLNNNIDMFKCFSKQDLSFMFFKMIKTNMVVDEEAFINTFLKQLNYKDQMEFILYNYSLVANNAFMNDLQGRYDFKRKPLFEKIFARQVRKRFVEDYTMLINLYKDLTRFRTDSMDSYKTKVSRKRRFMNSIFGKIPLKKVFNKGYKFAIKAIIGAIFKAIPFIGNIPWLSNLLTQMVSYFIFWIISIMVEAYKNSIVARNVVKSITEGFKNFFNKDIVGLNYEDHIKDKLNEDDDGDFSNQMDVKPDEIEKKFHKGMKKHDPANYDDLLFSMKNYFYMVTPVDMNKNPEGVLKIISAAKQDPNKEFFGEKFYPVNLKFVQNKDITEDQWYTKRIFGEENKTEEILEEDGDLGIDGIAQLALREQMERRQEILRRRLMKGYQPHKEANIPNGRAPKPPPQRPTEKAPTIPPNSNSPDNSGQQTGQNTESDPERSERRLKDTKRTVYRKTPLESFEDEFEYRHTLGEYMRKPVKNRFHRIFKGSLK
jgi:hypothetical protein